MSSSTHDEMFKMLKDFMSEHNMFCDEDFLKQPYMRDFFETLIQVPEDAQMYQTVSDDEEETNCQSCGDYMSDVEQEDYNEGCNVFCNKCSGDDDEESDDEEDPKSLYLTWPEPLKIDCKICGDTIKEEEIDFHASPHDVCDKCSYEDEITADEIYIDNTDKIWVVVTEHPRKTSVVGTIFDPDTSEEHPEKLTIHDLVKHDELVEAFDETGMREIPFYKTK